MLPLFAFAGWTVRIDGVGTSFSVDPDTGLIVVSVPIGVHDLDVELNGLPSDRPGTLISIASGAGLILMLVASHRRRGRPEVSPTAGKEAPSH